MLRPLCKRYPESLRRTRSFVNVDTQLLVGAFRKGRARQHVTHASMIQLFNMQVGYDVRMTVQRTLTASKAVEIALWGPSRESVVRLHPGSFQLMWNYVGPFTIDLITHSMYGQAVPQRLCWLPCFFQFLRAGSLGVDVLEQHNTRMPIPTNPRFRYALCPPPLMMV